MASSDDDDIEKLLRDMEASLGGPPERRRPAEPASTSPETGGRGDLLPYAVAAGAVAFGVTFVLFLILPFLSAWSGAWGAALTAFVLTALQRWRRR